MKLDIGQKHVLHGGYPVEIIETRPNPDYLDGWGQPKKDEPAIYYIGRFFFPGVVVAQFVWLLEDGCDWTEVPDNTYSIRGNEHPAKPLIFGRAIR